MGDGLSSVLRAALDLKLGSSATIAYLPGEPGGHLIFFVGADNGTVYVQVVFFPVPGLPGRCRTNPTTAMAVMDAHADRPLAAARDRNSTRCDTSNGSFAAWNAVTCSAASCA
ncbi:hypothetical protein GCM10009662_23940 [Catellatospora coxensis]|uniref:Uncharacterized protein n=1 Tax=Catellatospora coxensis TaxID=310354 RepID=A0A8J3KWF6_9ACTN|nr:hypothetical protein Cco03nite_41230 [Catellatospora coxensis]